MTNRSSSLRVLTLLLGLLAFTNAFSQGAAGAIEVRTNDAESSRPIQGIRVTVVARGSDGRGPVTLSTGPDGSAVFDELPAGLYDVTASGTGVVTVREPSVRVSARKTTPLEMNLLKADAEIEEVVVVARALQADRFGPVSSSILNREELRSAVGTGSDVMRALDGLPGLISTGDFANFTVRGRGPRDNLIFVDGLPFDKVVHFDQTLGEDEDIGGGGRFSIFAPNSIASAEFSPGGWSAAFGGRSGSLLELNVSGGAPSPSASLRIDIAGVEFIYEGPSGFHDDTTVFATARSFDFGRVFETIDQADIGTPELSDFIIKTVTEVDADNSIEVLAILAPEQYTRDIDNVLESPNFEDVGLIESEQDLGLFGVTWRRLVGDTAEWTNRLYLRDSDKTSSEGEAFPDLVPEGTPADQIPVNERILTVREQETELGWRSDFETENRFGALSLGLRLTRIDLDFTTALREDWIRYVYRSTDPRPPGQDFIVLTPENVDSAFAEAETSYAVYGEQVFELGDWDLRAGLRYDRDGFADESLVSPRFALNGRVTSDLRLSATAGVFYQSPRALVRAASPDNFGIRNERITHTSIGASLDFGGNWNVLVEPYYQQLDNLIVAEGRTSGRVDNSGDGSNYGVDVVLSRYFDNGWFANASYSYNNAERN
ncbi:MAG: TonB-dependent receptor, partial [Pseudomonadota bacterium]